MFKVVSLHYYLRDKPVNLLLNTRKDGRINKQ